MAVREDATTFVATDEYLAKNRPLFESVVSCAMLE